MKAINLRALRDKKLLTQRELADLAGLDRKVVTRFEAGKSGAVRSIRALATALGVEPSELFKEEEES